MAKEEKAKQRNIQAKRIWNEVKHREKERFWCVIAWINWMASHGIESKRNEMAKIKKKQKIEWMKAN